MRLFFFLFLISCSSLYRGKEVCGADAFVIDSYEIKRGKFSILAMEGKCFADFPKKYLLEYPDQIAEGDILTIFVFHPKRKDLTNTMQSISGSLGFRVANNRIKLPDLEPVEVGGLSLEEAEEKIQGAYLKELSDINVFVSYKKREIKKVELAGLVAISSYPIDGKVRLFDVLAKAKIPSHANLFKSYMIRDNNLVAVDFTKLIKEGDMSQNIVMRGGDKIYIADRFSATVMIMGEVGCQKVIDLPNGFVPLRKALAEAGGIPFTGDKSYIQVIRGSILCPKIYTLNWQHVLHLPNDSLLLIPGDIVYVAAKPITEWNRFISQLIPSLSGVETAGKACAPMMMVP
jgi:polysaccharide export outer membrane protein